MEEIQTQRIQGVPYVTEHRLTLLVKDIPVTYTYYSESDIKSALKKLKALGKRYQWESALYPVH